VAADHPEQARRAAQKVRVEYEVLRPVTQAEDALRPDAPRLHPDGNVTRHVKIRHGDQVARADVVVRGEYEIGMQDQAPLGPESGLAVPDAEGGVDLYIATPWLHVDQQQLANILAPPPDKVSPPRARRRRVRVELDRGDRQRLVFCGRALSLSERDDRWHRRVLEQPALRRDARIRFSPELLCA